MSLCISVHAYDFEANGFYYNILSETDKTCGVTYGHTNYTGDIVIPESATYNGTTYSVTRILSSAFYNNPITSVVIPNTVTYILDSAFGYCFNLKSVTIGKSVEWIGSEVFEYCEALTEINVVDGNKNFSSLDGILFDCDKTTLIQCPCAKSGEYIIPSSVTTIDGNAFSDCSAITDITIPNSVTTIGSNAFSGCSALTDITIPNSVTTIGGGAFSSCIALTEINVENGSTSYCSQDGVLFDYGKTMLIQCPGAKSGEYVIPNSVTTIDNSAFQNCAITSVTIPNSVTTIGNSAFQYCAITSVIIPNSVTEIGYSVFKYSAITSVTIPNSVTSIGTSAFENCALTSVTIPNSVITIGDEAFCFCNELESVTIGSSVTTIGSYAFEYCEALKEIYSYATTPPSCGSYTFNGVDFSSALLYVPIGSLETYRATEGWKRFMNINEFENTGINSITIGEENGNALIYDLNGVRLKAPQHGINIINGKKVLIK